MIFHKAVTSAKVAGNVLCHAGKLVRCPLPSPEKSAGEFGGGEKERCWEKQGLCCWIAFVSL